MEAAAHTYSPQAATDIGAYREAHGKVLADLKAQHPDLDLTPQRHAVEFHGTSEQLASTNQA